MLGLVGWVVGLGVVTVLVLGLLSVGLGSEALLWVGVVVFGAGVGCLLVLVLRVALLVGVLIIVGTAHVSRFGTIL